MRQKWLQKPPLGTPINCSHPSAKGRVGDWIFNEGGGDLVNDLSGNANHGTLKNMAFPPTTASGWNPGRAGVGLKFDGANDYVDCGNDASITGIDETTTIEAWINSSNPTKAHGMVFTPVSSSGGWCLRFDNTTGKMMFRVYYSGGSKQIIADNALSADTWYHIVGTYDQANIKIYVNGQQAATPVSYTGAIESPNIDIYIGSRDDGYGFEGQIDQVRIYNRALSAEEVLDSYVNPFGRFERTKWGLLVPTAPPIGLSIPVAMHNYRRLRA